MAEIWVVHEFAQWNLDIQVNEKYAKHIFESKGALNLNEKIVAYSKYPAKNISQRMGFETESLRCVCRVWTVSYLGQVSENSVVLVVAAVFLPTSSSETKESELWGTPKTNMRSLI